jgi:hypothetical protein
MITTVGFPPLRFTVVRTVARRRPAFDRERQVRAAFDRNRDRGTGRLHTGQAFEPLDHAPRQQLDLRRGCVLIPGQRSLEGQQVVRLKTAANSVQRGERADQQRGANQ